MHNAFKNESYKLDIGELKYHEDIIHKYYPNWKSSYFSTLHRLRFLRRCAEPHLAILANTEQN